MIYRIGKRKKLNAEINVVPYIDVMLVLLIIFMVLSPLLIQGIEVDLPTTDTTKMSISSEPLVISIDSTGKYFLNLGEEELPISLRELKNKANIIYQANPDIEIVFKSDANNQCSSPKSRYSVTVHAELRNHNQYFIFFNRLFC